MQFLCCLQLEDDYLISSFLLGRNMKAILDFEKKFM